VGRVREGEMQRQGEIHDFLQGQAANLLSWLTTHPEAMDMLTMHGETMLPIAFANMGIAAMGVGATNTDDGNGKKGSRTKTIFKLSTSFPEGFEYRHKATHTRDHWIERKRQLETILTQILREQFNNDPRKMLMNRVIYTTYHDADEKSFSGYSLLNQYSL